MVATPGKPEESRITDLTKEQQELLLANKPKKDEVLDADSAAEKLFTREQETIDFVRNRSNTLKDRLVRILKMRAPTDEGAMREAIREEGDNEANRDSVEVTLAKKVRTFGSRAKEHLQFFSRKTAEKLSRVTARIRAAERAKNGIEYMQEHWNHEIQRMSGLVADLREANRKQHPIRGQFPGWLRADLEGAEKGSQEMTQTIRSAANQVIQEENEEYKAYEAAAAERYKPERQAESKIREIFADHASSSLHELDEALDQAAQGNETALRGLFDTLTKGEKLEKLPTQIKEPLFASLEASMKILTSAEYGRSRAFTVASQLQLGGSVPPLETVSRLRKMPIGTKLEVKIPGVPDLPTRWVLLRQGTQNISFKEEGVGAKVILLDIRNASLVVENGKRKVEEKDKDKKKRQKEVPKYEAYKLSEKGLVTLALAA